MNSERTVLTVSIAVTVLISVFSIVFGILAGSSAIIFDGIYSLTDASMTVLALIVANLIATTATNRFAERFTMGFWHLEPMVLALNGMLLIGAAIYALVNAVASILAGGRELAFFQGIIYAAVTLITAVAMALFGTRANRTIRSDFLTLDIRAWWMSAGLTGALLIAFVFGLLIQGTSVEWLSPYVDPAALALICLILIPLPLGTVKQALTDILLVTPTDLKKQVDEIAARITQEYGFLSHRAYVAKVGRGRQVELYFIVPKAWPAKRLEEWDAIRNQIGKAIGGDTNHRWLTIAFTTDPDLAE
ncbi:cation diffusion facilitator family transporter [Limoniibacter endophyticus]|uniref:Cation diffusion facilitator transporter n=1 Tax=Limoniibacter endophyticus TaxID=1565040 RepID=A0A8J3DIB2_9HYPH|nr:cation transporter [Limoniibacter endophyticus]GHC69703.1 cation diffusion facilitator transporter [Limoniibacter endophyticus]